MALIAGCPRCREPLEHPGPAACAGHGAGPLLWRPEEPSYDDFALHLRAARDFPTYLPWPMGPGWAVSDFAVVTESDGVPVATLSCVSGTSELDGPVDALLVVEERGVGLGARCARLPADVADRELRRQPPAVRVRIGRMARPLWTVSTSTDPTTPELDRTVLAGEAAGRWLWVVLRPASAVLLMRDDWILRDVSGAGPQVLAMPFAGPRPGW